MTRQQVTKHDNNVKCHPTNNASILIIHAPVHAGKRAEGTQPQNIIKKNFFNVSLLEPKICISPAHVLLEGSAEKYY